MTTKICRQCSTMSETDKTFCPECGTPYFRGPAAAPQSAPAVQSSGKATAALILGILGIFFFGIVLGVLAIVFATIARREINESAPNTFRNSGSATAGLVLGIFDVVAGAFFLFIIFSYGL